MVESKKLSFSANTTDTKHNTNGNCIELKDYEVDDDDFDDDDEFIID